jgi:hypothetical protein
MPDPKQETAATAAPAPASTADVPLAKQESFWLTLVAVASAVASVLDVLIPALPNLDPNLRSVLIAVAAAAGSLAGRRARTPGADARARLLEVSQVAEAALQAGSGALETAGSVQDRLRSLETLAASRGDTAPRTLSYPVLELESEAALEAALVERQAAGWRLMADASHPTTGARTVLLAHDATGDRLRLDAPPPGMARGSAETAGATAAERLADLRRSLREPATGGGM